jgi:RHS repeat-associated protein
VAVAAPVAGLLVATASPAGAVTNPAPSAGARQGATRLNFTISGTASLSVDVGTGNALFTDQLVSLPGVTESVPVTLSYNSSVWNSSVPSAVTASNGSGWAITGFDQRLVANADSSVTYYGPNGLTGVFAASGSAYTAPSQFQATLVKTGTTGWTLTDHDSQTKLTFNSGGRLTESQDRNGNATMFNYSSGNPASIVSSRGGTGAETLSIGLAAGRISTLSQTSGSLTRTVTIGYSSLGNLASVRDTAGGTTSFASAYGTDTGQVVSITNPRGKTTTLSFASGGQVSQVTQANPPIDNGAGASTTRFSYPSGTQTLVADPTTNQSGSVASVPHTTYNLAADGSQLVSGTTDPNGHSRSATYTSLGQVKTTTPAAGGTTTFSYGANSGESPTSVASPGGATGTASYTNTGSNAYLPSSTTDDAGNATKYTYNGAGNQLTTAQSTGPSATVTYNSNGTAATTASPGAAAGVQTSYGYDASTHNLTSLTPPSGTSLGNRAYTWDGFGRLATASDGRGNTTTYTYDGLDRITKIDYSDAGTHDVTYGYDANGHVTTRTDGSGTTTYTYDDLGHLLSVANTAGGGTISYTYDLAGDVATETSSLGTVNYSYDPGHDLTSMTYPQNGSSLATYFAYDASDRRTDEWLQANSTHSTWAAHQHFSYDSSGRVTAAVGQNGPATAPVDVLNQTVCYSAGSTAPTCPSTATSDRSNVAWVRDSVSGQTTTYTYDDHARLTKAVITGGSNPRTYTYAYDTAGNRTSSSVTGSSPSSQTLTFNAANQISTAGYTYDGAGNLTAWPGHTAAYNTAGQQTSTTNSGVTTTYTYAGSNSDELLSQATSGAQTYNYVYGRPDQNGLPEVETTSTGASTGYVFHDAVGQPVMLQTNSSVTCLYLYDAAGNPAALATSFNTTSYTYSYDPYGGATRTDSNGSNGGSTLNPYLFRGGLQDRASGQLDFGARHYNPATGAWAQQDQLNAPLDPTNANRYAYVGANPVNRADPTGDSVLGCIGGALSIAGGVLGLAGSIASAVGTGGLDTPAALAIGGASLGLAGSGVAEVDAC